MILLWPFVLTGVCLFACGRRWSVNLKDSGGGEKGYVCICMYYLVKTSVLLVEGRRYFRGLPNDGVAFSGWRVLQSWDLARFVDRSANLTQLVGME